MRVSEPRFLIVHGRTQSGYSSPDWPTAEDPFAVLNRPDGEWFTWRLLSGNNRELGRGASAYETELGCLAAITRLQTRSEVSTSSIGVRSSGQWWWQLELDGERIAVAGRVYQRQRECRYNLDQFLLALPEAQRPPASGQAAARSEMTVAAVFPLHRDARPPSIRVITPTERLRRTRTAP
jgi:hypothetical protein